MTESAWPDPPTMYVRVARGTQCKPIAQNEPKIGDFSPMLNMMRSEVNLGATLLAGVVITRKNSFAPLGISTARAQASVFARSASFPGGMISTAANTRRHNSLPPTSFPYRIRHVPLSRNPILSSLRDCPGWFGPRGGVHLVPVAIGTRAAARSTSGDRPATVLAVPGFWLGHVTSPKKSSPQAGGVVVQATPSKPLGSI